MRPKHCPRALPLLTALATLTFAPASAHAQERSTPALSLHGFGTVGAVYSSEDLADFVWNPLQPSGPGHSGTLSPDVDSRLGLQLSAYLTPKLSAVVQVVAEQTYRDDYRPGLEWAYLDYAVTPELSFRAGRRPVSSFMVSEYRKVSYVNPWIRPPVEMYGLSPVANGESVEASYRIHQGEWTNTVQLGFGRSAGKFDTGFPDENGSTEADTEAEAVWSISNTVERGSFTGRVAFARGRLNLDVFDPFFDIFRLFGPEGDAIADRYEVKDTPFHTLSVGAEYDPGPWFGIAEVAWADLNSVLGEKVAGYVTAGYRLGPVTPYATFSLVDAVSETTDDGLTVSAYPPEYQEDAAVMNFFLDFFLQGTPRQHNVAVGGRWEVRPGLALTAQVDFIDVFENSPGTFINQQPGWEPGGSAQLFSVAAAFVF